MDTFDALAPRYDKPARVREVRHWFAELQWDEVDVHLGSNGMSATRSDP
jgi:hypothetical protein